MLDGDERMLIDSRTALESRRFVADCSDISVEHRRDCCIVWRLMPNGRVGWAEPYANHDGNRDRAEAAARFKSARSVED